MDRPGQLLGKDGVDAALPGDPALAGKALGDDLEPEMGLLAVLRAGVMAGMQVRIVINGEALRLERSLELLTDPVGDSHDGMALCAKTALCQVSVKYRPEA